MRMSSHTKIWTNKRAQLLEKEKQLKDELETVSNLFEGKTKTILLASAITGGLALLLYVGYKAFSPKKPEVTKKEKITAKAKKKISKQAVIGTLITERLISAGLKFAEDQLSQILSGERKKKK
jgi:hypothetical protein